jgi:hypothetical protein
MTRRNTFSVKLRRSATGEEHVRTIFAADESTAKERAIAKARAVLPLFGGNTNDLRCRLVTSIQEGRFVPEGRHRANLA